MNIVILGAGDIGSYIASILSKEEYNITLIDKDADKLEKISSDTDVATHYGYATEWKIFDDLLENSPTFFLALTGNDETNLVACSIAKNLGYPQTIARVKEIGFLARSRLDFGCLFFVDNFLGAEVLAAHDILKGILHPSDLAMENFAHGAIQMRSIIITDEWDKSNIPIKDLPFPEEIIISLIRRKNIEAETDPEVNKDNIIFPHGEDYIMPGDEVTIIGKTQTMLELHDFFPAPKKQVSSVTIIGGSAVALRLAHILEKLHIDVRIIEKDPNRAQELADFLPNCTILNHNGTDTQYLLSQQIQHTDILVPCTNKDETNLLISLLGKQAGCKKIISLISDTTLGPLLRDLDIKFSVSEKVNIANRILAILHGEKIVSVASLCDNQAKVIEIKVSPESKIIGIPIADLSHHLPKNLLIAAIENRGRVMIGRGSRIISPNDTIIIISSPEHVQELKNIF